MGGWVILIACGKWKVEIIFQSKTCNVDILILDRRETDLPLESFPIQELSKLIKSLRGTSVEK